MAVAVEPGAKQYQEAVAALKQKPERILLYATRPSYYLSLEVNKRQLVKLTNGEYERVQSGMHRHVQFVLHRATHWTDADGELHPLSAADLPIIRKRHGYGREFAEAVAPDNDKDQMSLAHMRKAKGLQNTFQCFCRECERRDDETLVKGAHRIQQYEIENELDAVKAGTYPFLD